MTSPKQVISQQEVVPVPPTDYQTKQNKYGTEDDQSDDRYRERIRAIVQGKSFRSSSWSHKFIEGRR
jgi:hypothetical protein